MAVKLARLANVPENQDGQARPNRRREPRFAAWFDARLENAHGECADVSLAELSLHGCRIKGDAGWLRVGAFVSISLDDGDGLQAVVRWVRDGSAGMEFLRPVPPESARWHELMEEPF